MQLDPSAIRRLAFIKYLYSLGVQQSRAPEPLAGASILTFHDAAELFLYLAAEIHNVAQPKMEFMGYLTTLAKHLGLSALPLQSSMHRLNSARVALKHQGILPSKLENEGFRAIIANFFEENTPLLFSREFAAISLTDVVQPDNAREYLKSAEERLSKSLFADALQDTCVAFDQMLVDYEDRKRDRFGRSIFGFGRELRIPVSLLNERGALADFMREACDNLNAMQAGFKMLALGIDYSQYLKFRLLTPSFFKNMSGTYKFYEGHTGPVTQSKEDVQFCIDFVILSALQLQESDFDLPKHIPGVRITQLPET